MSSNPRSQALPITLRARQSWARLDRTTRISLAVLALATVFLVGLIALITIFPAQAISQALSAQASQQQMVLAESLARQCEAYFNGIAYELLDLANHPEIKASAHTSRNAALSQLAALGQEHPGQIKSIVRISSDGKPLYGWPDDYDKRVQAGQTPPWSVDRTWVQSVAQNRGAQFRPQLLTAGGVTYLLAVQINQATTNSEALAVELDLNSYFKATFEALNLSPTSQLWVFDHTGTEVYRFREQPVFTGSFDRISRNEKPTLLANYPSDGRESVLAPVFAVSMPGNADHPSLAILLSHATSEGQESVYSTLRVEFLLAVIVAGFIVLFGLVVARFLWLENYRRRDDARRRSSIRTLLTTSRAVNSSLDLNRVLALILDELKRLLPHDNATIFLLNDDKTTVSVAAEAGQVIIEEGRHALPLDSLPREKDVILAGKSIVLNRVVDPRWTSTEGSDRTYAWLGVPLRFRTEAVGLLAIESNKANRFRSEDIDLAEAFADQASVALQNARAHEYQIHSYEAELETARAIQSSLLPNEDPPVPQMQMAARTIAARQVSGDYYQYYLMPGGKIGIAVGDVSGKGTPAALLMAVITTSMREEILRVPSAAALLYRLNKRLVERMKQTNMNSALLMTFFDPATRHLEVANAGMVQPYVYDGMGWKEMPVGGYPVGAAAGSNYAAKTVTLAPGSMLVIVTDGIIESQNLQKEFFGFERLEAVLAHLPAEASANQVADTIINAVRLHLEGQDPQDDMTVVIVKSVDL